MTPPPPWIYRPQPWDREELQHEYNKRPPPSTIPSRHIDVIILEEGNVSPLRLIATDDALKLGETGKTFRYSDIRYVTTNCRAFARDDDLYVILVSLRTGRGFLVANLFIKTENAAATLATLNFLQYHIFQYLSLSLGQVDPSVVQQYMRPLLAPQQFDMQVHRRQTGETVTAPRILLLDKECVSLYDPRSYQAVPTEPPMFFWREKDVKSVSKISRIKSANCILFQSPELYIVVPYNQEMASDLEREIRSVGNGDTPKKAFLDPRVLLQWLEEDYYEELEEEMVQDFEPIEISREQDEKIGRLRRELRDGMKGFLGSPSERVWTNREPELKSLLRGGALPSAGAKPAGFNPNDVNHLLGMLQRIEELLFQRVDYNQALATTLQMRRLFLKSGVQQIRDLMEREDALSLMKKIYARGNMDTRQRSSYTGQDTGDDDDDMTGGFADEDD